MVELKESSSKLKLVSERGSKELLTVNPFAVVTTYMSSIYNIDICLVYSGMMVLM